MADESAHLTAVDSEIALVALLAAAVTGYSVPSLAAYPAVKLSALGLLALTLVRRTGVVAGVADDATAIRATTYLMDAATNVALLYLAFVLARQVVGILGFGRPPGVLAFCAVTIGLLIAVFVGSTLLFDEPLAEGERVFAAAAEQHRGEVLGAAFEGFAGWVGSSRRAAGEMRQAPLSRFYDRPAGDYSMAERKAIAKSTVIMVGIALLALAGYVAVGAIGARVLAVGWPRAFLLLLTVMLVDGYVRLWYSDYGLVRVEDRNGVVTFLGIAVVFLIVGHMVA